MDLTSITASLPVKYLIEAKYISNLATSEDDSKSLNETEKTRFIELASRIG